MVHETVQRRTDYTAPRVSYHGRVHDLTLSDHLEFGVHAFQMAAAFTSSVITSNNPQPSGGGGGGGGAVTQGVSPQDATGGGVPTGSGGGNLPGGAISDNLPAGTEAVGTTGSEPGATTTAAAASEGGRLPFTGLAVALMAGAGVAAASGGALLKRVARRGS